MKTFESRTSRRVIVRLDRGEDLVQSLESLARRERIRAAAVRGTGSISWVELDRHDQSRKKPEPPQRFDTPCDVLAIEGNIALSEGTPRATLYATLARRTDNGVDMLGGRVRAASVFACELVLECFDDLTLTRAHDDDTGLALLAGGQEQAGASTVWAREVERDETEEEETPEQAPRAGAISWADVAAVSAAPQVVQEPPRRGPTRRPSEPPLRGTSVPERRRTTEEEFFAEPQPEKGDFIEHRQFGLCRIDREDEDGGLIIRLPSGVRKVIKLDFMEVGQPRIEGTRRIFPVRPRRR